MEAKKLFFDAIRKNDVNLVKDLIYQIGNLNFYQPPEPPNIYTIGLLMLDYDKTPLMIASKFGYDEIIIMLLKAGANIDFANLFGYTALMFAVNYNHITSVQILLDAGANINLKTDEGSTAIIKAANEGNKEIVLALINAGANVNILGEYGITALISAASNNHKEIVLALIDAEADLNLQTVIGITALMMAANKGHKEIILVLIDAGADVNILNDYKQTALMMAVEKDHKEIVLALIDAGTNINIPDKYGYTALITASLKGHKKFVIMLLNAGADIDIQNMSRITALMFASRYGHDKIVSILLEAGANINLTNNKGLTALAIAFKKNHLNIVDLIKNYIPDDPDQIDSDGFTNLMIVASNGPIYKLREFLRRVEDVDAQDPRGNTALIYAVLNGNLQMAELLLNAGANPLIENLENKSAYHYMMKSTHSKIRKLGNDVFIASTQSETVIKGLRTYYTRRAAEQFRREYQGKKFNLQEEEKLRPEFHEYYVECAKDDNWEKVFLLAEILGVPREKIENKTQAEICSIIRRFISLLT